jgi:hypothetical protein
MKLSARSDRELLPDDAVARRRRIVAWIGTGMAVAGVIVWVFARSLIVLWVFMIAFGIAELPKAISDLIRQRPS